MAPILFTCLFVIQIIGAFAVLDLQGSEQVQRAFPDDDDLQRQYDMLNSVVKRQTKGSCSCTCETKPMSSDDKAASSDQSTPSRGGDKHPHDSANIMRTGAGGRTGAALWEAPFEPKSASAENDGYQMLKSQRIGGRPVSGSRVYEPFAESSNSDASRAWPEHSQDEDGDLRKSKGSQTGRLSDNEKSDEISGSWGHGSRFPWRLLPDRMCFREGCQQDSDCCQKFNLCDRSARVCVDCWDGSTCVTEQQCCQKYPYCKRTHDGSQADNDAGRCVNKY
jgi:hypothetical protein